MPIHGICEVNMSSPTMIIFHVHVCTYMQARHVAMVIGQAFSVAYKEFLRATGISEAALEQAEYAHVLNAQSAPQAELDMLRDRKKTRKVRYLH